MPITPNRHSRIPTTSPRGPATIPSPVPQGSRIPLISNPKAVVTPSRTVGQPTPPRSISQPTTPRGVAQPATPRNASHSTTPKSAGKPTTPRSIPRPTTPRSTAQPTTPRSAPQSITQGIGQPTPVTRPTAPRSTAYPNMLRGIIKAVPGTTKQVSNSIPRPVGTKAVSQGTVSPAMKSKVKALGGIAGSPFNDFKSADPIRPSANTNVQGGEGTKPKELTGSGESAAVKFQILPEQKAPGIKKGCGIPVPESRLPVKVLMSPKPVSIVSRCLSRSPFGQSTTPFLISDCIVNESNDLNVAMENTTNEEQTTDDEAVMIRPSEIQYLEKKEEDGTQVEGFSGLPDEKDFVQQREHSVIPNACNGDWNPDPCEIAEGVDSTIELISISPPPELHDVVSDPKLAEILPRSSESWFEAIEAIQQPSLVESLDDLEQMPEVESSPIQTSIVLDDQFDIEAVLELEERMREEEKEEMDQFYFEDHSNEDIRELDYRIPLPFEPPSISETEDIPLGSEDNCNDEENIVPPVRLSCFDDFKTSTVEENILRLEDVFLPFMMDEGLRAEVHSVPDDCGETQPLRSQDFGDIDDFENNPSESYQNHEFASVDDFPSMVPTSGGFDVHIPKDVVLIQKSQPLLFEGTITIHNGEDRRLMYKVLTSNRSRYAINPVVGFIPGFGSCAVKLESVFATHEEFPDVVNDSFLVLIAEAHPSKLTEGALRAHWKMIQERLPLLYMTVKIEEVILAGFQNVLPLNKKKERAKNVQEPVKTPVQPKVDKPFSTSDNLENELPIELSNLNRELRNIDKHIREITKWGCVGLYVGSLAFIGILVLKDIESVVPSPVEPEPPGWFDWIPFFGK